MEMAKITGTAASTPIPAMLRRRPKMILSSDRRNRVEIPARGGLPINASSAADIESLSSQRHEDVLKAWPKYGEAEHRHASIHQVRHDLLDSHVAQRRFHATRRGHNLAQTQLVQNSSGIFGPIGVDAYGLHRASAQFAQRALRNQPALIHHPNVAADLFHF